MKSRLWNPSQDQPTSPMRTLFAIPALLILVFALNGCGGGGSGESSDTVDVLGETPLSESDPVDPGTEAPPTTSEPIDSGAETPPPADEPGNPGTGAPPPVSDPGDPSAESPPPHSEPSDPGMDVPLILTPQLTGFNVISDETWDETAVRKVLHTFAYGGHATDAQIRTWADMPPRAAIVEILSFDQHNLKLSPVTDQNYDDLDTRDGTLTALSAFWSSDDPRNGIFINHRPEYQLRIYKNRLWERAATSRGLNPFRQKIGLWETNYHLAVNRLAGVTAPQAIRYYDDIMSALADGASYEAVLSVASLSAAVATQYGHHKNAYINNQCRCNEDFAREYHQLFFGILGEYDPDHHETVTIKNTARALTGMPIERNEKGDLLETVIFAPELHYPGSLNILNVEFGGTSAKERIEELSRFAIEHDESLRNLPVKIINDLADNNLTSAKIAKIQLAWSVMAPKNLLDFLRAYAVSDLFHDETRVKFLTSIDRHLLIANQITLNNEENYLDLYWADSYEDEGVEVFFPEHNVFGGQTSIEAADSAAIFRNNFNRLTAGPAGNWYRYTSIERYGRTWQKNWASVAAKTNGRYLVKDVAEWLWNRFIADGLTNFGDLERMHVYALLASDRDIGYLRNPQDPGRLISSADLATDPDLLRLVSSLANSELALESTDAGERTTANRRIGQAINFIVGTPYIFAQEGR